MTVSSIVATAEADITAAKAKIESAIAVLNAHIAAHQAEVTAAQAIIQKAVPTASANAAEGAAIILTAPSAVQNAAAWIESHIRTVIVIACVALLAYAKFSLKII